MKLGETNSSLSVVELHKDLSFSLNLSFGLCASKEKLHNSNNQSENNKEQLKMCYLLTYLRWLHMIVLENTLVCIRMAVLLPSLQLSPFGLHCFSPLAVILFTFTFSQKHPAHPHTRDRPDMKRPCQGHLAEEPLVLPYRPSTGPAMR